PAGRRPPPDAAAATSLAGAAAAGRLRRPRLLHRARQAGEPFRPGPGIPARLPAHHRRPGHRGPVVHHGSGEAHRPVDEPSRHADRRPPPRRRPRAAFRAVSGLVLALLITTAAVVAIAT